MIGCPVCSFWRWQAKDGCLRLVSFPPAHRARAGGPFALITVSSSTVPRIGTGLNNLCFRQF